MTFDLAEHLLTCIAEDEAKARDRKSLADCEAKREIVGLWQDYKKWSDEDPTEFGGAAHVLGLVLAELFRYQWPPSEPFPPAV